MSRNAKTKAASSGRFELNSFFPRPTFICFLLSFLLRLTYPAPIIKFRPFLVRSFIRCDYASKAVTSLSADVCVHPTFLLDSCHSYFMCDLSSQRPCCCQKHMNVPFRERKVFVNPAWSVILAHCHFQIAVLLPWPVSYGVPAICTLFALFRFTFLLFRWVEFVTSIIIVWALTEISFLLSSN